MTDIAERPAASVWPGLFAAMRRPGGRHGGPWIGWILPVVIIVAWQASASLGWTADTVMPSPYAVAAAAWRLTLSGELPQNLVVSALRALAGLVVGGGIGLALGLLNGLSRLSFSVTDTSVQMIRNVPHLALIPLVIVWFGIDEGAKLFIVALGVFFPIYLNTLHGVRSIDPQLIEMAGSYGFRGWPLFRRVIWPGALPSILVGLRFALGVMWLTLIFAETIAAQSGIGYMAMQAREFMQTYFNETRDILLYAFLGKGADFLVRFLERWQLGLATRFARTAVTPLSVAIEHDTRLSRPAAGAPLTLRGVRRSFGAKTVLDGVDLHVPRWAVPDRCRPQRLRQEHAAAAHRRPRRTDCGKDRSRRGLGGTGSPGAHHVSGAAAAALGTCARPKCRGRAWPGSGPVLGRCEGSSRERARRGSASATSVGKWPSVLSGGQKQRVALARALVSHPRASWLSMSRSARSMR